MLLSMDNRSTFEIETGEFAEPLLGGMVIGECSLSGGREAPEMAPLTFDTNPCLIPVFPDLTDSLKACRVGARRGFPEVFGPRAGAKIDAPVIEPIAVPVIDVQPERSVDNQAVKVNATSAAIPRGVSPTVRLDLGEPAEARNGFEVRLIDNGEEALGERDQPAAIGSGSEPTGGGDSDEGATREKADEDRLIGRYIRKARIEWLRERGYHRSADEVEAEEDPDDETSAGQGTEAPRAP